MKTPTQILQDLVSIPSVNPMGRQVSGDIYLEHRVADYLEDFFRDLGVPYERTTVSPGRDNVVARLDRGGARRTVLFEAHQDTVPVEQMTIDPFGAVVENGRLYGRGACDIKGGMTSMLTAFRRLVREQPAGRPNVVMACVVDEEHTFTGITHLVESGFRADMAVVAEPTRLQIVHAHKGVVRWHLLTRGRSCHSSSPEKGVNAIYRMGRVLVGVEEFARRLQASQADPLLGPPTLSVGRVEGGSSVNTVPDFCRVEIDRRLIPGEEPESAPGELEAFLRREAGIDFPVESTPLWINLPALSPELSGELVQKLGAAIDRRRSRHEVLAVPYGTDAAPLARAGIPAVIFGPGDIAQAHTCDEWIDLAEVEAAAEVLYDFASRE